MKKKEQKPIAGDGGVMFSTADQCVMSALSLVQLAPRAKARVNDMQVIQIMCKLQKVFQVCVSTSDRPSSAWVFYFFLGQICTLDPAREAQMICYRPRFFWLRRCYVFIGVIEMLKLNTGSFKKLHDPSSVLLHRCVIVTGQWFLFFKPVFADHGLHSSCLLFFFLITNFLLLRQQKKYLQIYTCLYCGLEKTNKLEC